MGMNRRSFLKNMGALVGIAYISPTSLIPNIPVNGNTLISPNVMAQEALSQLEWTLTFVEPAMKKLAEDIDMEIYNSITKG